MEFKKFQLEIWNVNLPQGVGVEKQGFRPCLVISNDRYVDAPFKIIVPITDWKLHYADYDWFVRLEPNSQNGLGKMSGVDLQSVRMISENRFVKKLGTVDESAFPQVIKAFDFIIERLITNAEKGQCEIWEYSHSHSSAKNPLYCLVISNNEEVKLPLRTVVRLTNWDEKYNGRKAYVKISPDATNGLTSPLCATCVDINSFDMQRLTQKVGTISEEDYNKIYKTVNFVIS